MATENNILESQLKKYFCNVKKLLLCNSKNKSKILLDLKNNVYDYIENNPDTDFDNILEHFGTPNSIAEEFAAEMGSDYIKKAKFNIMSKIIVITILSVILIFVGILTTIIMINNSRNAVYYYVESVSDLGTIE